MKNCGISFFFTLPYLETTVSPIAKHEGLSFNGTARLKIVNSYLNSNIYSYLETFGGQSSNLYLNEVHFFNTVLIRHLWQLKTVVILHWCLIHAVPLGFNLTNGLTDTLEPSSILIYLV